MPKRRPLLPTPLQQFRVRSRSTLSDSFVEVTAHAFALAAAVVALAAGAVVNGILRAESSSKVSRGRGGARGITRNVLTAAIASCLLLPMVSAREAVVEALPSRLEARNSSELNTTSVNICEQKEETVITPDFVPVIVVPYSTGDYKILPEAMETFASPFTPFGAENVPTMDLDSEPLEMTSEQLAVDIACTLQSLDFQKSLLEASESITNVDVNGVHGMTRHPSIQPSQVPTPMPTEFQCTCLVE